MPNLIAQVAFNAQDGLPRDQMENVFHFIAATTDMSTEGAAIVAALNGFYNNPANSGANSISYYLSPVLAPLAHVKVYDEAAVKPRPIAYQGTFTLLGPNSNEGMPEEVALCLSYYTDVNRPSHRGRLYLGPFGINAMSQSTSTDEGGKTSRPNPSLINAMTQAAASLARTGGGDFGVWALKSVKLGNTYTAIHNGWVDNEWDAQRRRRLAASARTTWAGTA